MAVLRSPHKQAEYHGVVPNLKQIILNLEQVNYGGLVKEYGLVIAAQFVQGTNTGHMHTHSETEMFGMIKGKYRITPDEPAMEDDYVLANKVGRVPGMINHGGYMGAMAMDDPDEIKARWTSIKVLEQYFAGAIKITPESSIVTLHEEITRCHEWESNQHQDVIIYQFRKEDVQPIDVIFGGPVIQKYLKQGDLWIHQDHEATYIHTDPDVISQLGMEAQIAAVCRDPRYYET